MENKEAIEELKEYHKTMDEYDLEYMEILISKELCDLAIQALKNEARQKELIEKYKKETTIPPTPAHIWDYLYALEEVEVSDE